MGTIKGIHGQNIVRDHLDGGFGAALSVIKVLHQTIEVKLELSWKAILFFFFFTSLHSNPPLWL